LRVIFVDTSAWFAASVPSDRNHLAADAYLSAADPRLLVTTDYVLAESLTLFRMRGERRRATEFGKRAFEERLCRIEWVQKDDVLKAWIAFETFRDQKWSFVDCVSRTVTERLRISQAFAFDDHFRQFGIVAVVPSR
jgi:predicted nucleic acid-binding protein